MRSSSPIRFGSVAVFDLGASNPRQGNLRIRLFTDEGKPVGQDYRGPIAENGFATGQDMVKGIAQQLKKMYSDHKHLLPSKDVLKAIAGFVPAPPKAGKVLAFQNLRTTSGDVPQSINFNELSKHLQDISSQQPLKLIIANDMMGGAAELVNQAEHGSRMPFKAGTSGVYMAIGGGFGFSEFAHKGSHVDIKTTELGNIPLFDQPGTLESTGASATAVVNHFDAHLPSALRGIALQQLTPLCVTSYEQAKTVLPGLTPEQHQQASFHAVQAYTQALAKAFCIKVLEGINVGVIAGPLNRGIEAYVNNHPSLFEDAAQTPLPPYLEAHKPNLFHRLIYHHMLKHRGVAQDSMMALNDFHLNTGFNIDDNAVGGFRVLQGELVGQSERSNWLKLPLKSKQTP